MQILKRRTWTSTVLTFTPTYAHGGCWSRLSYWLGCGNTPWVSHLSILGDWQMYSKLTNVHMPLMFIWAVFHVLSWQLCFSARFTAACSETLKTGGCWLVAKLPVPIRSTAAIHTPKWLRQASMLQAFSNCGFCAVFYYYYFKYGKIVLDY